MSFADHTPARRVGIVVAVAAGALTIWTVLASMACLWGLGVLRDFPHPYWQWWLYLAYARDNPLVRHWLLLSGGGAAAAMVGLVVFWLTGPTPRPSLRPRLFGGPRAPLRAASDNHGHSAWATVAEMRRLFGGPDPAYGGVVVGEAYRVDEDRKARGRFVPSEPRSWGMGGKAPLLVDPCRDGSTHSAIFAGSGGFKTQCAITTLLTWHGSAVVLDPSCELGPMLRGAKEAAGQRVVMLNPDDPEGDGLNVLDWIDTDAADAEVNVKAVASWLGGEQAVRGGDNAEFFRSWGKMLVACLIAHVLWDDTLPPEDRTLRTVRAGLVLPMDEMRRALRAIRQGSNSGMARDVAASLMDMVDETFSGICGNAAEMTFWLSIPAYARLVSRGTLRTADITQGGLTVFVQAPLKTLDSTPALGRVVVGALLNAAYEADGKVRGRILFLLDEVARLGRMSILAQARDAGRKYGITLQLIYQSVGQMEENWTREGRRAWDDALSWRGYAAVADMDTAKAVAEACGNFGVLAASEGSNTGTQGGMGKGSRSRGRNSNLHEIRRALIRPEELTQDMRTDEMIVLARGSKPIRVGRAIAFRRPDIMAKIDANRFHQQAAE